MKKLSFLLAIPNLLVVGALGLELGLACENLLAYPAYVVACVVGLVAAMSGIVYGLRSGRRGTLLAVLCTTSIAAYALLPAIGGWRTSLEFALKRSGYLEVVDLVQQGLLKPGSASLADIDAAHQGLLPCIKQIAIEENDRGLSIIFFTANGIFGEFRGYMYVADGRPPTIQQFRELRALSPDQWTRIERMDEKWYYVVWNH